MINDESKNFTIKNGIYKGQVKNYITYNKGMGELIWTGIKSHGNKIAHLDAITEETVTYAELQDKIIRCALWLQKQGIKSGDIISLCTGNHLNSIVPCISATYINAIFNPWNEHWDSRTVLYFFQMIEPKIIFCSEKSVNIVLTVIKEHNYNTTVVVFGKHVDAISFFDILKECNDMDVINFRYIEPDDIKQTACIMHSSGTTGMPKGVEYSNYSISLLAQQNWTNLSNTISLWYSNLYWLTGLFMNYHGIMQGTKAIIYPEFDEEMTCKLIEKYKISVIFLSMSMINRLFYSNCLKKYSLPSLKDTMISGALANSKVQEEIRRILPHITTRNCYGMTELCSVATIQQANSKNGSCGTIFENVQLKLIDLNNGEIIGPNQLGEVCIITPGLMKGYYKNPEATKNTIDKEGWLHSGDIGYMDKDGELFIVDRIKDLIKYRGYQIFPGEIENVLMSHPAVLEAAVIGVPHITDNEHPIAFVTKKPGVEVTKQELIDFIADNMMDIYKLRAGVIFLDSLPRTVTGKVTKKDLKEMVQKLKRDE